MAKFNYKVIDGVICINPSTPNIDAEIEKVSNFIIEKEGKIYPIIYRNLIGWWTGYDYNTKEFLYIGLLDIFAAIARRKFYLKFDSYETALEFMYLKENKI